MITYIAIYMVIGLVVAAYALFHQYYFLNRSIRVRDLVITFGFCLIGWPLVVWFAILEFLPSVEQIEKLMNKVAINKRK